MASTAGEGAGDGAAGEAFGQVEQLLGGLGRLELGLGEGNVLTGEGPQSGETECDGGGLKQKIAA